jgi:hypothetical protein
MPLHHTRPDADHEPAGGLLLDLVSRRAKKHKNSRQAFAKNGNSTRRAASN